MKYHHFLNPFNLTLGFPISVHAGLTSQHNGLWIFPSRKVCRIVDLVGKVFMKSSSQRESPHKRLTLVSLWDSPGPPRISWEMHVKVCEPIKVWSRTCWDKDPVPSQALHLSSSPQLTVAHCHTLTKILPSSHNRLRSKQISFQQ